MIVVSRLNGAQFALNPDLLERAEATPDTVLTLCDGSKLVIRESLPELVELVRDFRASVLARARALEEGQQEAPSLRLLSRSEED